MNAALNREGRPRGTGPAFPTSLGDFPSTLGYACRRADDKVILPASGDILAQARPGSLPGSTSRPGGPFQPVARRGFDMPKIGASALRRRRFALGVRA